MLPVHVLYHLDTGRNRLCYSNQQRSVKLSLLQNKAGTKPDSIRYEK